MPKIQAKELKSGHDATKYKSYEQQLTRRQQAKQLSKLMEFGKVSGSSTAVTAVSPLSLRFSVLLFAYFSWKHDI